MDRIAVISNGEISEIGSYNELLTHNGAFAQFLKTFLLKEDSEDSESDDPESTPQIFKISNEIIFNPNFYIVLNQSLVNWVAGFSCKEINLYKLLQKIKELGKWYKNNSFFNS